MKDIQDAGEFAVTTGLSNGHEYVFVTHRETGKQWMSKSEAGHTTSHDLLATNIKLGITKFDPHAVIGSCDPRFWMPVKQPRNQNFSIV